MRFEVPITYRCDRVCQWCDRCVGVIPWRNTDLTIRDVERAGKLVKSHKLEITLLKVSGGEPTLHPHLYELVDLLKKWPMPGKMVRISTNKPRKEFKEIPGTLTLWAPIKVMHTKAKGGHQPNLISPADLGLKPEQMNKGCRLMEKCGGVFDVFGFTFCHVAPVIGRLLRIDPYGAEPIIVGREDICRHCTQSLSSLVRKYYWEEAAKGRLVHPTKTYHEALKRKPPQFAKFRDRK